MPEEKDEKKKGINMIPFFREQSANRRDPFTLVTHIDGKPIKQKKKE